VWTPSPSGRHALIGAVIGFGLGAAVGAKGNGGARVSLTLGTIGGMMGAAFGLMTPSYRARSPYWRVPWPDQGDESASEIDPAKATLTEPSVSSQITPPSPALPEPTGSVPLPLAEVP
jgi:hypothetical protein